MREQREAPGRSFRADAGLIAAAFVVAVLFLAAAAASALRSAQRVVEADRRGAETYDRLAQLSAVLDAAIDAETGSRGYVITGDVAFLEPFDRGLAAASAEMDRLEALYDEDSARRPLLAQVRDALVAQREHMSLTVDLRRSAGASAAAALVSSGRGRVLTEAVRASIGAMVAEERAALARQRGEEEAAAAAATRTLIVEGLVGLVLLALAFGALKRENRRRRAAVHQVEELNRDLESRIAQAKADLEESEARLRRALDGLLEGCALLDFDLRYLYTNPSSARQGRTTVDQMLGRTLLDVYPGSEGSALVSAMRRTLDERTTQEVELEFVFPDGSSGWFELHMQPVPEGLFALSFETTDRVRADRAREATEGRLRALLESLPEQVLVLDRDGLVLDFHVPAGTVPIAPPQELLGRPLVESLAPVPAALFAGAIRQVVESGTAQTVQYDVVSASGRARFEAMIVATEGDRLTVVVRDVTARLDLEDQLRQAQKMEAVGQLTGGIAHDFNNVLTIIGSNAEMLSTGAVSGVSGSSELQEIMTATRRGADMIAQLLAFSRRGMLRRKRVVVRTVIREFLAMLERLLPAYIRIELGPLDAEETVLLDPGALEQVLANLCTNARDAMPKGGSLRIDCECSWLDAGYHATHPWVKPGPYVCVSVSDTGAGMDEATRQRIFEPFFTTKPTGVGTGLGMAMVYGMMKEHDGMVHVYSEVGRGTVVKLYFPVSIGTPPDGTPRKHSDSGTIVGGSECVLIAEDEPAIRLSARRALQGKGYDVLDAADGEQALALWREHRDRIAIVISDLVMPNLGGLQLAQVLRAEGSNVPVLFTSGYSAEAVYRDGDMPPDVEFLHKPWTLAQLFTRVRELVDGRHSNG